MNPELRRLLSVLSANVGQQPLQLAFGIACAARVRHLLLDSRAVEALDVGQAFLTGQCDRQALEEAARIATQVAASHPGSHSIDGSGHAAVSATHAVARALAGQALVAADYAAYAMVYAYGGYAVNDPSAFAEEHVWQIQTLQQLSRTASDSSG